MLSPLLDTWLRLVNEVDTKKITTDKYSAESDYDEDADLEFYYGEENECV